MSEAIRCFVVRPVPTGRFELGLDFLTLDQLPPGAMWYADWYKRKGPDGHHLIVKTPGGIWHIDGRANNCTRPNDKEHYCWVRHGVPPDITIDKNGNTCGCGHSIDQGPGYSNYHGFLTNGFLVPV